MPGLDPGIHVFLAVAFVDGGVKPGHDSGGQRHKCHYSFTPARAAAWLTYLLVCWNAFSSALAVDMSAISAKCPAIASGVQSDGAKLTPSVSMTLMTAKEPAPAPMMVRVGASSDSR